MSDINIIKWLCTTISPQKSTKYIVTGMWCWLLIVPFSSKMTLPGSIIKKIHILCLLGRDAFRMLVSRRASLTKFKCPKVKILIEHFYFITYIHFGIHTLKYNGWTSKCVYMWFFRKHSQDFLFRMVKRSQNCKSKHKHYKPIST